MRFSILAGFFVFLNSENTSALVMAMSTPLEIEQIVHILHGAIGDDRQNAQIFSIVKRLTEFRCEAEEASFEQAADDANGPGIDAGYILRLALCNGGRPPRILRDDDCLRLTLWASGLRLA